MTHAEKIAKLKKLLALSVAIDAEWQAAFNAFHKLFPDAAGDTWADICELAKAFVHADARRERHRKVIEELRARMARQLGETEPPTPTTPKAIHK